MISSYFDAPSALERMRSGSVGPHIDGFATVLAKAGYAPSTIRSYVRAAVHLGRWVDARGILLSTLDDGFLGPFRRHLSRCRCFNRSKGVFKGAVSGAEKLLAYLRLHGAVAPMKSAVPTTTATTLSQRFATWMLRHRGVAPSTVARYEFALRPFLAELGEDPRGYNAIRIREFVVEQLGNRGIGDCRSAVSAIRALLRFLVAEGRVAAGIENCVPTVPQWRLSSLPRYLEAPAVERIVSSCDVSKPHGLRDHAILLLLARLGLRGGDILTMSVDDVDWKRGTLRVRGKGRREALLPVPQDVGDALLAYLERGRPQAATDRMFLTVFAPIRPFGLDPVRWTVGLRCLPYREHRLELGRTHVADGRV